MKFVARVAAGMFLVGAAAPTASLADPGQHDAMRHYNQPNAQSSHHAAPRASHVRKRGAKKRHVAAAPKAATLFGGGFAAAGNPRWVSVARQYKGTNPTGRRSLWCADFLNLVLKKSGMQGTSSSMAKSFASYGTRIPGPKVGAIAILSRGKGGGHVGIVTGIDESGNPILISGNHNNTVAEASYSRGRIIAYVWPNA
ncbi:MAG TPA: TIGR02594 family protein [Xanthobacteraceae bacterium]|nr:TIGR02594 family protein [Xanthobacteraceae bacterium]